jgi:hypothetical protein
MLMLKLKLRLRLRLKLKPPVLVLMRILRGMRMLMRMLMEKTWKCCHRQKRRNQSR